MLVYQNGDFTFINYVDSVQPLTTYYKISGVENRVVVTPDLGSNYVLIWSNGETQTSGSPKPGGTIFLQNDYVAIAYSDSKNSFDIVYSVSYSFKEEYRSLEINGHYSTDLCRVAGSSPSSTAFVPGGILTVLPDVAIDGIKADYVALKYGLPIGYFGVQDQSYFGLPFPVDDDREKIAALAHSIITSNGDCYYCKAPAVDGVLSRNAIKGYIENIRTQMGNYQQIDLDYTIATAFKMPTTSAESNSGLVLSALDLANARAYINDLGEGDYNNVISGFVLDSLGFVEMLTNGVEGASNIDILRSNKTPSSAMVLLNSDFNAILTYYKLVYDRTRAEVTVEGLTKMKSEIRELMSRLNVSAASYAGNYIKEQIAKKCKIAVSGVSSDISVDLVSSKLLTLESLDLTYNDENVSEKVPGFLILMKETIAEFGQDSTLDPKNLDVSQMDKVDWFNIKGLNDNSFNIIRAKSTIKKIVDSELENFQADVSLGNFDVDLQFRNCRSVCIHHRDPLTIKAFHNRGFNVEVTAVRIYCNRVELDVKYTSRSLDSDVGAKISETSNGLKNAVKDRFRGSFEVQCTSDLNFTGTLRRGWNASCRRSESPAYDNNGSVNAWMTFTFTKKFEVNLSKLDLCSHKDVLGPAFGISVAEFNNKATLLSGAVELAINKYAADVAYTVCEPLFAECKDRYQYKAIGVIGKDYDGIVVGLNDIAKISSIDVDYVNGIIKLINSIPDPELKSSLTQFVNDLSSVVGSFELTERVYYLTEAAVNNAESYSSPAALLHYLYGGA